MKPARRPRQPTRHLQARRHTPGHQQARRPARQEKVAPVLPAETALSRLPSKLLRYARWAQVKTNPMLKAELPRLNPPLLRRGNSRCRQRSTSSSGQSRNSQRKRTQQLVVPSRIRIPLAGPLPGTIGRLLIYPRMFAQCILSRCTRISAQKRSAHSKKSIGSATRTGCFSGGTITLHPRRNACYG